MSFIKAASPDVGQPASRRARPLSSPVPAGEARRRAECWCRRFCARVVTAQSRGFDVAHVGARLAALRSPRMRGNGQLLRGRLMSKLWSFGRYGWMACGIGYYTTLFDRARNALHCEASHKTSQLRGTFFTLRLALIPPGVRTPGCAVLGA